MKKSQSRNEEQSTLFQKEIKDGVKEGFKMMLEHIQSNTLRAQERYKAFEEHFTTQGKSTLYKIGLHEYLFVRY